MANEFRCIFTSVDSCDCDCRRLKHPYDIIDDYLCRYAGKESLDELTEEERAEAINGLKAIAKSGDVEAQITLGCAYDVHKRGVMHSRKNAEKWWKLAAKQDNAEAQYLLGDTYGDRSGDSNKKAQKWWNLAAEQGHPGAIFRLGYSIDCENMSDTEQAMDFFKRSAEKCHRSAFELGKIYFCNRYVEDDISEAKRYFRMSAELIDKSPESEYEECSCDDEQDDATLWLRFVEDTEYGEGKPGAEEDDPHYILRWSGYADSARTFNFPDRSIGRSPEFFVLEELIGDWGYGYTKIKEFENDRGGYENDVFITRPFWWGDEDAPDYEEKFALPNFLYKSTGFEIEWYKYAFRDSYMNQKLNETEVRKIFRACAESVMENIRQLRENNSI